MTKYILIFSILFPLHLCKAQETKGIVLYKKEFTRTFSSDSAFLKKYKNNPNLIKRIKDIDFIKNQTVNQLTFKLAFENSKSIFNVQVFLDKDSNKLSPFALGPEGGIIYYTDLKAKVNIKQIDAFGDLFLVNYPMQKWKLSSESKMIGKFKCYKATTVKKTKSRNGIISKTVEAWYTPEIAIPFGPLGYNGLPGLIIELRSHDFKYYVSKISLNPNRKITIKKPSKGKNVSKEEFEGIGISTMKEFKKGF